MNKLLASLFFVMAMLAMPVVSSARDFTLKDMAAALEKEAPDKVVKVSAEGNDLVMTLSDDLFDSEGFKEMFADLDSADVEQLSALIKPIMLDSFGDEKDELASLLELFDANIVFRFKLGEQMLSLKFTPEELRGN